MPSSPISPACAMPGSARLLADSAESTPPRCTRRQARARRRCAARRKRLVEPAIRPPTLVAAAAAAAGARAGQRGFLGEVDVRLDLRLEGIRIPGHVAPRERFALPRPHLECLEGRAAGR